MTYHVTGSDMNLFLGIVIGYILRLVTAEKEPE
jgi:hypothetical protein